ncbi:arm repeat protein interacting with ABF2 [Dichanthelium oligosanthes]|uniref:Arm repeat protein interacting with ABF2 n=1 Tax=Dichanthelium oligosanthes TaxID=888268 RepID=A0A1E5WAQ1_9POAL|nr:arm repeat protein interacting with ABF2 [Dichanthelium oligosanthes]
MEAEQQKQQPQRPRRKGQKRKLEDEAVAAAVAAAAAAASSLGSAGADDDNEEEEEEDGSAAASQICCRHSHATLAREVSTQVDVLLRCASSWRHADRAAAKRATHVLAELAKNEEVVNVIVEGGAVPALVRHLEEPAAAAAQEDQQLRPFEHEVEKGAAFALGLLAVKGCEFKFKISVAYYFGQFSHLIGVPLQQPEHQQLIVDAGALPPLVNLLRRQKNTTNSRVVNSVIKRAADAITNLAHENSNIKTSVRMEGGIPPLVELLESQDLKVQRAAAGALRTLAFKNDENKTQIVQCNALPTLILMLQSEDAAIHYEAVGVIGNLVHSSPNIKKEVLNAGALQPVIGLLRYGHNTQDTHNQAGIAYNGGLLPLLKLLDSKNGSLQHNAAFALYGVADNEDYVSDFIKVGGVQKLQDGEFIVQATKDCVAKTLKRLEEKINGRVLKHLLYMMRVGEKSVQRRVALALAHLCAPEDQRTIFIDNNGLDLLLDLLISMSSKHQQDGSAALYKLANKAAALSPMDAAPPSPTPQVYLGEQYVNSSTLSDVTFLVEGKRFYAHRIALLASSDAFRAMFDGGYREKDARDIEIPNIRWDVFELMMRFIYTGSVQVTSEIAQDVLRAADQYLLEGLKRLCEYTIAKDVNLDNVSDMYDLSEAFHAVSLRHTCILYILEHFNKICTRAGSTQLIQRVIPELRNFLTKALSSRSPSDKSAQT